MAHILHLIPYAGWNNCIHLTNSICEAVITTEVGPRIVRYGKVGGPNLLYLDEFAAGQTEETKTWRAYAGRSFDAVVDGDIFLPPENTPVSYTLGTDRIDFDSVDFDGLSKTISIRMCRRGGLEIKQTFTNTSNTSKQVYAIGSTLLPSGGIAAMPLTHKPVTGFNRPELRQGQTLSLIEPNQVNPAEFEIAGHADELWCGYFHQGQLFIMTSPPTEGTYDGDTNICFSADPKRARICSYSPKQTLASGESLTHIEVWNIFDRMPRPIDEKQAIKALRNNKFYYEFRKMPVRGIDY